MKKWYKVTFSAYMDNDDICAMQGCFFDAMCEAMQIEECSDLSIDLEDVENKDLREADLHLESDHEETYLITNIDYCIEREDVESYFDREDIEEKDIDELRQKIVDTLPEKLTVTICVCAGDCISDLLAETISDETGWLVNSFCYEKLKTKK